MIHDTEMLPALGAAVGGAAAIYVLARKLKKAEQRPPPSKMQVYGFIPLAPDPDSSPACIKLLTFLKMTKNEFDLVPLSEHGMNGSPKGKVPWAHAAILGTKPMADSSLIMDALVRADPAKYDLDAHLTKEEHAMGTAFRIMLEESTYFAFAAVRWKTDEFERCSVPLYFSSVPFLLRGLIAKQIRRKILRDLKGQGIGLLDDKEVLQKAEKEIRALSVFLGSKKYLLGNRLSSYDAAVYAYCAAMIQGDWQHPLIEAAKGCRNIVDYVARMRNEFWPELQQTS